MQRVPNAKDIDASLIYLEALLDGLIDKVETHKNRITTFETDLKSIHELKSPELSPEAPD